MHSIDPTGLRDFWLVYEKHYDAMQAELMEIARTHRSFGPIVAMMTPEMVAMQNADSLDRMRKAVNGDWGPYLENLNMQGTVYAAMGVGFGEWYDIIRPFGSYMLPRMVEAFATEPARLTTALLAMQQFLDSAMLAIAEQYISSKESLLRQSEERLATTLDSIGDGVIATDANGMVERMNPVAARLTGWTFAEAKGKPLTDVFKIINENTRAPVESPAARVLREGVVVGLANHTALLGRDGVERPIADSGAPIRDAQGRMLGVVLVFRDQTEERARDAALEANRLKSEFLANMSHELRTPLNAILGFAELLADRKVGPESKQYGEFLGHILKSGRHLLQLINDVLDLAKVEAGKTEFHPEYVDLKMLVEEVSAILRTTAAAKGIVVDKKIDPNLRAVTDPGRFKQVLYNYLSNALKFTGEGGRVSLRVHADQDDAFTLEVEDTGAGIAADDVPRLFVEFQQLDSGKAKQHSGTGLGLALTKKLVEAQGGTVAVRSTLGKGSVFSARLPRATPTPVEPVAQSATALPGQPTILVIEDEARDRGFLVETLTRAGYFVDIAVTGKQALHNIATRRYDAITLDLLLPDLGGLDILNQLRADERHKDVPVVVVTVVAEKGVVAGFSVHDILAKPLDSGALLDSLRRAQVVPDQAGAVLCVDDDAGCLRLMEVALGQLGYRCVCKSDGAAALAAVEEVKPVAVVLDLVMPGLSGLEFLDLFRRDPNNRRTPVIVWTVKDLGGDERARLQSLAQAVVQKGHEGTSALLDELRAVLGRS
jgi:PAS domain S-box-containing protein